MNPYVELARKAIDSFLKEQKIIDPPKELPSDLTKQRAGVFVTLHRKDNNELQGCIGTIEATKGNIAKEIISNAISAASSDPRFESITVNDLDNLDIKVDILSKFEEVDSIESLDSKTLGVYIKTDDGRAGLLLPDIEGVDDVNAQLSIACQKGMIDPKLDKYKIYSFKVTRHKEN